MFDQCVERRICGSLNGNIRLVLGIRRYVTARVNVASGFFLLSCGNIVSR